MISEDGVSHCKMLPYLISTFISFNLFLRPSLATIIYQLDTAYSGSAFFDGFDFFTGHDPTNGFVNYVNRNDATARGLILAAEGAPALMSVDDANVYDSNANTYDATFTNGRPSVRIASRKSWTKALIVSDIAHMPGGICGTWPACEYALLTPASRTNRSYVVWTEDGSTWPNNGEYAP